MDANLTLRLELFENTDGVDPRVVPFVRTELNSLGLPTERMTDELLGTFASHLINALNRSLKGEALNEFSAQEVIDAVIAENPQLLDQARALADRAHADLGTELPETEVRILTLHLGTIR